MAFILKVYIPIRFKRLDNYCCLVMVPGGYYPAPVLNSRIDILNFLKFTIDLLMKYCIIV